MILDIEPSGIHINRYLIAVFNGTNALDKNGNISPLIVRDRKKYYYNSTREAIAQIKRHYSSVKRIKSVYHDSITFEVSGGPGTN